MTALQHWSDMTNDKRRAHLRTLHGIEPVTARKYAIRLEGAREHAKLHKNATEPWGHTHGQSMIAGDVFGPEGGTA